MAGGEVVIYQNLSQLIGFGGVDATAKTEGLKSFFGWNAFDQMAKLFFGHGRYCRSFSMRME